MQELKQQNELIAQKIGFSLSETVVLNDSAFNADWNKLMLAVEHIEDKMKYNGRSLMVKMGANHCTISADRWSEDGEDFGSATELASSDRIEQPRIAHVFQAVVRFFEKH